MSEKQKIKRLPLFYKAIEYFDKSETQEFLINEQLNNMENRRINTTLLRDEMLNELNNLKNLIDNNPDLKLKALTKEEKEYFSNFIKFYQICPICYQYNHYRNLKKLYFDEENSFLKEKLIKFMNLKSKKLSKLNLSFGIPCCTCYKKLMNDSF
ncbi:MAG: hypothetical protein ACFE8L_01785 [Candidatus Hodarchaeota archaeon]